MLTPLPWMSSPSTITSPRLMAMRNSSRSSAGAPAFSSAFRALDVDRAAQGVDDALELYQDAVAHRLDEAAVMRGDLGLENILEIGLEAGARTLLVDLAQAAIADDIGDHHGG